MAYPLKYWDGSSWNTVAQAAVDYSFVPQPNLLDNGAFDVWQRGTGSFNPGSGEGYTADRWLVTGAGVVNRQRHPVGTAFRGTVPKYYLHMERGAAGNHPSLTQRVEDACTAAGQTVTMSFWVRAPQAWNAGSWQVGWVQYFGTGGSSYVADFGVHTFIPTADWQFVQATFTLPSVTGKSVNDNDSFLSLLLRNNSSAATTGQLDVWGVKLEVGSTATAFQHKSFAEELRECQRYYYRAVGLSNGCILASGGMGLSTTSARMHMQMPVTLRAQATSVEYNDCRLDDGYTGSWAANSMAVNTAFSALQTTTLTTGAASGLVAGRWYALVAGSTSGYVGVSADL